jgi:hypothetical protein
MLYRSLQHSESADLLRPPSQRTLAIDVADFAERHGMSRRTAYATAQANYVALVRQQHLQLQFIDRGIDASWPFFDGPRGVDLLVGWGPYRLGLASRLRGAAATSTGVYKASNSADEAPGATTLIVVELVVEPGSKAIRGFELHPPSDVDLVCEILNRLVLSERMSAFKRNHHQLAECLSRHVLLDAESAMADLEATALSIARNLGLPAGSSVDKRRELQVLLARHGVVDVAAAMGELSALGITTAETENKSA